MVVNYLFVFFWEDLVRVAPAPLTIDTISPKLKALSSHNCNIIVNPFITKSLHGATSMVIRDLNFLFLHVLSFLYVALSLIYYLLHILLFVIEIIHYSHTTLMSIWLLTTHTQEWILYFISFNLPLKAFTMI